MKAILKFILISLILFTASVNSFAYVYSKIVSKEKVNGKVDCWMIKYELWETHDTVTPLDDTRIGTYFTLAGDCNPDGALINPYNDVIIFGKEESMDFEIAPNPTFNSLDIVIPVISKDNKIKWWIYNIEGKKILGGEFENEHLIKENIDLKSLDQGIYLFSIINGEEHLTKKFIKL